MGLIPKWSEKVALFGIRLQLAQAVYRNEIPEALLNQFKLDLVEIEELMEK